MFSFENRPFFRVCFAVRDHLHPSCNLISFPCIRRDRRIPQEMSPFVMPRCRKQKVKRMEYSVRINGIDTTAHYEERAVQELFLPLLRHLTDLQTQKGGRVLVLLAAPPGAGKTTLLSFLETLSKTHPGLCPVQVIGMDGFHRRQEYLLSHTVSRDGQDIPMVRIKGAPVTFDLQRLKESIERVASGEICSWPVYDRLLHNPVDDALQVNSKIVFLDGNYLLLDEEGWRDLSSYADYTISLTADEQLLRTNLIDRRIKTGVERERAIRFVDFSDMPNVRLCLQKTKRADLRLQIINNGDYRLADEPAIVE